MPGPSQLHKVFSSSLCTFGCCLEASPPCSCQHCSRRALLQAGLLFQSHISCCADTCTDHTIPACTHSSACMHRHTSAHACSHALLSNLPFQAKQEFLSWKTYQVQCSPSSRGTCTPMTPSSTLLKCIFLPALVANTELLPWLTCGCVFCPKPSLI